MFMYEKYPTYGTHPNDEAAASYVVHLSFWQHFAYESVLVEQLTRQISTGSYSKNVEKKEMEDSPPHRIDSLSLSKFRFSPHC